MAEDPSKRELLKETIKTNIRCVVLLRRIVIVALEEVSATLVSDHCQKQPVFRDFHCTEHRDPPEETFYR
jgi:hypothetical protein